MHCGKKNMNAKIKIIKKQIEKILKKKTLYEHTFHLLSKE